MPAIVSIVGNSNSGKTTLIEKLIGELKSRCYRVATVKHTAHGMNLDQAGTDSWHHIQAGSDATAIVSREQVVLVRPVKSDITLDEVTRLFGEDYDIILVEGFKQENAPKIVVHRREAGPFPSSIKAPIAIATDEPVDSSVRQFSLDDAKGLAELLEKDFMQPRK